MIPDFNKMTPKEIAHYMHIPVKRVCVKCGKRKEQNNGNDLMCNSCLADNAKKQSELQISRDAFSRFADKHPTLSFNELIKLYKA